MLKASHGNELHVEMKILPLGPVQSWDKNIKMADNPCPPILRQAFSCAIHLWVEFKAYK